MNAPTNIQIINGVDGKPAFVVIPYEEYRQQVAAELIPHEVVRRMTLDNVSIVRAWREHLGFTQQAIADKLGISQSAYAQQENSDKLRRSSRLKIADALGVSLNALEEPDEFDSPTFVVDFTQRSIDAILSHAAKNGEEVEIDVKSTSDPAETYVGTGRLNEEGIFEIVVKTPQGRQEHDHTFETLIDAALARKNQ